MAGTPRRPTLRDVGFAADVSIYTASRALGDYPDVSQSTRQRVRDAAKLLAYVPNQVARNLRADASKTVGVLTANTANAYYATLVRAISQTLRSAGLQCVEADAVDEGRLSFDRERMFVTSLIAHRVAGIVLTYVPCGDSMHLLRQWGIPLVFVDCIPPTEFDPVSSVGPDNYRASLEVGRHFAEHGYRRWLFVGHAAVWTSRLDRERGFVDAARACGAEVRVVEGGNDPDTALLALRSLFESLERTDWPRAIYASNEPLLNGTVSLLRELRMRIPEDVAVVGFDDFSWAVAMDPPLTVIDQRIGEIGQIAGEQMLDALAGRPVSTRVVEPRFEIRRSCGGPRAADTTINV